MTQLRHVRDDDVGVAASSSRGEVVRELPGRSSTSCSCAASTSRCRCGSRSCRRGRPWTCQVARQQRHRPPRPTPASGAAAAAVELSSGFGVRAPAYLDACGLTPTADEVRTFLADKSPDKRAKLIEALARTAGVRRVLGAEVVRPAPQRGESLDKKGRRALPPVDQELVRRRPAALTEFARGARAARGAPTRTRRPASTGRSASRTRAGGVGGTGLPGVAGRCAPLPQSPVRPLDAGRLPPVRGAVRGWTTASREQPQGRPRTSTSSSASRSCWRNARASCRTHAAATLPESSSAARHRICREVPTAWEALAATGWRRRRIRCFARAQANRVWLHLTGRGLVDPNDDFRTSNPPSNPALLDADACSSSPVGIG